MSNQIAQTDADAAELAHYGYEQILERQTGKFASTGWSLRSSW
jgi:hypothetical protein